MRVVLRSILNRIWRTLVSVETGVVLLMLVVIFSALGTLILQRPTTRPEELERSYSPAVLAALDALGLTDIFHSWWFLGLVFLVSLCILAASIHRFPHRWRHFSRPYKYPEESFRHAVRPQHSVVLAAGGAAAVAVEELGLTAAERALQARGFAPERVECPGRRGLFAEQHRISELAAYIVHASLLLIFFGTFVDGFWGWRGTLSLAQGQASNVVELRDGRRRTLPFSLRCDAAGQESYPDGTLKNLWSRVAVVRSGQELLRKEIVVNDPLLYEGVRFFESPVGQHGYSGGPVELEVSREPGQWIVWPGVILMGLGLVCVFYLSHMRFWVVPVRDPKTGKLSLWIGGSANRNRDRFERRFRDLVASIENELGPMTGSTSKV